MEYYSHDGAGGYSSEQMIYYESLRQSIRANSAVYGDENWKEKWTYGYVTMVRIFAEYILVLWASRIIVFRAAKLRRYSAACKWFGKNLSTSNST
jgi:hypothetical protein